MTTNKKACITGISGQDGYYLSNLLLDKGYEVVGVVRRVANRDLSHLDKRIIIVEGDLSDTIGMHKIISEGQFDEFYNLGAQSHVGTSFKQPEATLNITGSGVLRILEGIRQYSPKTKFYQASTSELFGNSPAPQSEETPFQPCSPYAAAKMYAHDLVRIYRDSYGIFACAGILMNHESPYRSKDFVTRKITSWLGDNIKNLKNHRGFSPLQLGNIYSRRDWGFAGDYVRAMWLMMQKDIPKDYVIGTNSAHSVKEFCNIAFEHVKLPITWYGEGLDEYAVDNYGRVVIKINPDFYRPNEVNYLQGNYLLAYRELFWEPKVSFEQLVKLMVDHDVYTKNPTDNQQKIKTTLQCS